MALKYLLDEASYTALNEALKPEYKKVGEEYQLNITGGPKVEDVTPLKNALENAKRERQEAKDKVTTLETELDTLRAQVGDKSNDRATLDASWQAKLDRVTADYEAKDANYQKQLANLTIGKAASDIANAISTVPDLFEDKVSRRLEVDLTGDTPVIRVLDRDGKPSALTLDDLKKELAEDPRYKAIIKASDASGGGAGGAGQGGGATGKKISEMNEQERVQAYSTLGEAEFNRRNAAGQ